MVLITLIMLVKSLFLNLLSENNTCKNEVMQAYRNLPNVNNVNGKTAYMELAIKSFSNTAGRGVAQSGTSIINYYSNGKKYYYKAPDIEVLQGDKRMVVIYKMQKTILITNINPDAAKLQLNNMFMLRDSIIQKAELVACKPVQFKPGEPMGKKITLQLSPALRAASPFQSLDFWIDTTNKRVRRVVLTYAPGNPISRLDVAYIKQSLDTKTDKLDQDPVALVLNSKGKLLPGYTGYRLVNKSN